MRLVRVLLSGMLVAVLLTGCALAPAARKPPTINVAAVIFGGGAPPQVLSLYKAAMEVNRNSGGEFDIHITTVSPAPYRPEDGAPPTDPPTVTALEQALGQQPPPDIVIFTSSYEFNAALQKDLLQSLSSYAKSDRAIDLDDYFSGAIEALSDQGQLYGLPITVAPMVLQYDTRVFDAAGVEPPSGDWDWSTFVNLAKALTKVTGNPQSDTYGLMLQTPAAIFPLIWQNGGDVLSEDGQRVLLAEPAAVEAIKFYRDLTYTYKVTPPPFMGGKGGAPVSAVAIAMPAIGPGDVPPIMGPGGRAAMQILQSYGGAYLDKGSYMAGANSPFRLAELPKGKVKATLLDVETILALTSKAQDGRTAYRALGALAAEMQKDLTVPASRSAAQNLRQINPNITEEDAKVIINSLEYARVVPGFGDLRIMQPFYEKLFSPLQQPDSKDPAELAKEAAEAIELALNSELEPAQGGTILPGMK